MKYIFGILITLAVIIVAITIGANNDQLITFNYVIAQSELRLSTLVAILFGFGLILGWLITGIFYLRIKLQNITLNRRVRRQAQQITELTTTTPKVSNARITVPFVTYSCALRLVYGATQCKEGSRNC
ncbi:hypothetical protein AP518_00892 [Actinobacillus pleuropneumoniae]|nr:hypothetical protein AP518_00892 [Actinobacillus pleuropneumoniae]KIE91595.1 hypothetical protein AP1022_00811 [Actinobacillus pleuropneumoniae]KIE97012.1 hypothetical protein AP5651_00889 [Actinobacillus pleuropneumoniae]